ncbi:Fc.00g054000.m01.CDS01 [Cosmosporella sp. VM-42]
MADLRQACDRCHDKKLRCSKPPGALVCGRCAKANVHCIFSPPTRSLRNGKNGQDASFDWSPLTGFDQMPTAFITTPPVSDSAEKASFSGEVSQLTDLMASLDLIYYEFPPPGLRHLPADQIKQFTEGMAATFDLQLTLEQLLQRTQQLVSLYPLILKHVAQKARTRYPADEACIIPDCMHRLRQSLETRPQPKLDHAKLNLLLACHLRLLDILDNIINHARLCAHVVQSLPNDHEPQFDIPEIRIGSFVAPKGSAASMLVSMMIELQTSLTTKCQDLVELISSMSEQAPREAQVLGLQCEALSDRSTATLADLQTLRSHMLMTGLLG